MPSKELIAQIVDICENSPMEEGWDEVAVRILSTILAALQEPTEGMTANGYVHCYNPARTWQAMLAASALGEQSE